MKRFKNISVKSLLIINYCMIFIVLFIFTTEHMWFRNQNADSLSVLRDYRSSQWALDDITDNLSHITTDMLFRFSTNIDLSDPTYFQEYDWDSIGSQNDSIRNDINEYSTTASTKTDKENIAAILTSFDTYLNNLDKVKHLLSAADRNAIASATVFGDFYLSLSDLNRALSRLKFDRVNEILSEIDDKSREQYEKSISYDSFMNEIRRIILYFVSILELLLMYVTLDALKREQRQAIAWPDDAA